MSEAQASALAELQSLADGLEELTQGDWLDLLGKVGEQLADVTSTEQALSTLKERAGELLQAAESFDAGRDAAARSLQALGHDLSAESESWQSGLNDAGDRLQDASGTLKGVLASHLQQGTDQVDQVRDMLVGQLHVAHLERLREGGSAIAESTRGARAKAEGLGGDLVSKAQDGLRQMEQRLKEDLGSRIEQQAGQRFADEAARLGGEVANNLVLSQASVAITGAVTPILPQLIALKAAVGAIKLALHPFA